jgi:hypothetical protein
MHQDEISKRFEAALAAEDPFAALHALARALAAEGMSEQELSQIFDQYRELHCHDPDERLYNAIRDTMDCICGWCSSQMRIFLR